MVWLLAGLAIVTGCSDTPVDSRTAQEKLLAATQEVGLPPLPEYRAEVYDYYKLGFFEDGYPGRRTEIGMVPHPIYGAYVIKDYLRQYNSTESPVFLDAARQVADAAIARMDDSDGMLRFFYEPQWKLGASGSRYVSGLTQARYLDQLSWLAEVTSDPRYTRAAEQIFLSLSTPVESGGALAQTPYGPVIEEEPHRPRDVVLNGWLSALFVLQRYINRTDSPQARHLLETNLETVVKILPLYDVPSLLNSRYRIRGFGYLRLAFEDPDGVTLSRPVLRIPGDGEYPLEDTIKNRWHTGLVKGATVRNDRFEVTDRQVLLNLVLSLLSMPEPNVLQFEIQCPKPQELVLELATGEYDPLLTGLKTTGWDELDRIALEPGLNVISVELGFDEVSPFVYPTNFKKRIAGRNHNAYHFIHVDQLAFLCNEYEIERLCDFHRRWSEYIPGWPDHPAYQDEDIEFDRYRAPEN